MFLQCFVIGFLCSACSFLGATILGLARKYFYVVLTWNLSNSRTVSWRLALPGLSPVPLIIVAAYYNIIFLERYEHDVQKPLEEGSAFASENVDAIKVSNSLSGVSLMLSTGIYRQLQLLDEKAS